MITQTPTKGRQALTLTAGHNVCMLCLSLGPLPSVQARTLKKRRQIWKRSSPKNGRGANHHSPDWTRLPRSKSERVKLGQARPGRLPPGPPFPPAHSKPQHQQVVWLRQQSQRWRVRRRRRRRKMVGLRSASCRRLTQDNCRATKTRMATWTRETLAEVCLLFSKPQLCGEHFVSTPNKNVQTNQLMTVFFIVVSHREQNQWPGQKNGEAVCRESSEETSRGRQHFPREEGRGRGTDCKTRCDQSSVHSCGMQCCVVVHYVCVCVCVCGDSTQIWRRAVSGWFPP